MSHASRQYDEIKPLVSVIIPAYNAEQFISYTLDSVLAQTYTHYEVLVVDDGSQDSTANIVHDYAKKDERIKLLQQPNSGVAAARNLGIEFSAGEFIAPLDADDIWHAKNLEKQLSKFLDSASNVGLVYVWSIDINEKNNLTGIFRAAHIEGNVYATLLLHDFIANASSVMFRKSCLNQVRNYNTSLKDQLGQGREDWDLYLRIAECYKFKVIPEFLVGYRKLPNSMSKDYASMAKSNEIIWQSVLQKYPKMPSILYRLSTSSFYMHLAHQSFSSGDSKTALFWIKEALKKDCLTPMLRLGLYKAAFSYFFLEKLKAHKLSPSANQHMHSGEQVGQNNLPLIWQETGSDTIVMTGLARNNKLKVVVERIIHFIISLVFKNPSAWIGNSSTHA